MQFPNLTAALLAAAALTLAACGILTAPISLPAAVAENASFSFKGTTVDSSGKTLEGVIVQLHDVHHFWTPLAGGRDVYDNLTRRVDGPFVFDVRGSSMELTFTKDGYQDTTLRLNANEPSKAVTDQGTWKNVENFPVVLLPAKGRPAALAHFSTSISYADYPLADCISLPNLATNARNGDILFSGKDASDPTIFPPGTLYLTLDKQPPTPLDTKGNIDPADLDIPAHITLHIPGPQAGFIRIEPRAGYNPLTTTDTAPPKGYGRDLTLPRARLKEMRQSPTDDTITANEYFYFRTPAGPAGVGTRYGKALLSWATYSGKPAFHLDIYLQPQIENRDLTLWKIPR